MHTDTRWDSCHSFAMLMLALKTEGTLMRFGGRVHN